MIPEFELVFWRQVWVLDLGGCRAKLFVFFKVLLAYLTSFVASSGRSVTSLFVDP